MSRNTTNPEMHLTEAEPAAVHTAIGCSGDGAGAGPVSFDMAAGNMDSNLSVDTPSTPAASHVDMGSSLAPSNIPGVQITALGVSVTSDAAITSEVCHTLINTATAMYRACNWVLGDTLLLCERTWGNQHVQGKYDEVANATGMTKGSLMNIVATCRAFPRDKRHARLSFTHHSEVAASRKTSDQREATLKLAEESGMSCQDLRKYLRSSEQAAMTTEEKRVITGENDDLPFGLIKLPTKEEAANALPIARELSVVACWLDRHSANTLSEKYKTALEERLRPLIDYAKTLNLL